MTENAQKKTVALLCGGRSSEHPISLITAVGVLGAIDSSVYDVVTIGITKDGRWYLTNLEELSALLDAAPAHAEFTGGSHQVFLPLGAGDSRVHLVDADGNLEYGPALDVVFPLIHGPFGEDGTIQGLLELAELPYVGCGVTASAVGMDKHFMKVAFESAGLEVGPYEVVTDRQWTHEREESLKRITALGYPMFVKPTRAGSSFGITKVDKFEELVPAIEEARLHDAKIIVEAGIVGREIECGVLDGHHGDMPRASYLAKSRLLMRTTVSMILMLNISQSLRQLPGAPPIYRRICRSVCVLWRLRRFWPLTAKDCHAQISSILRMVVW